MLIDAIQSLDIWWCHDALIRLAANMRKHYVRPTAEGWVEPPPILEDGKVVVDGEVGLRLLSDEQLSQFMKTGKTIGSTGGREVRNYLERRPYGKPSWWRVKGNPLVVVSAVAPANESEAAEFMEGVVELFEDAAGMFTDAVFNSWLYLDPDDDRQQLWNRLNPLQSMLESAADADAVEEAVARVDALLREADRLSIDDDILTWHAGKDLDDSPYWRSSHALWAKVHGARADRQMKLKAFEDAENQFLDSIDWGDDDPGDDGGDGAPADGPGGDSPAGQTGGAVMQPEAPFDETGPAGSGSLEGRVTAAISSILRPGEAEELELIARSLLDAAGNQRVAEWTPFPVDALPKVLANFIDSAALAHSVDPAAVALPVLATMAGALGNVVRLEVKPGHLVPPTLWCVFVAPTGSNKTGPLHLVLGPLWDTPPMPEANTLLTPMQGQYVIDDSTREAVLARLAECPRGLLLAGEEMSGWLSSFDAYRKGAGGDQQAWIRLWDVKPYRVDRKGSDERVVIRAPAVSIAGAIQPALLAKATSPEAMVGGFFARTLAAMPPERKRQWSGAGVDETQEALWRAIVDRLRTIPFASLDSNTGTFQPNPIRLTPAAQTRWILWFNEVADRLHGSFGVERVITAKADVQAARIALVLYGLSVALGEVSLGQPMAESTMEAGVCLAGWFLDETIRVFKATCGEAQDGRQVSLLDLVRRHGGKLTPRQLQRSNARKYPTSEAAQDALRNLAAAGHGTFDGKVFILSRPPAG